MNTLHLGLSAHKDFFAWGLLGGINYFLIYYTCDSRGNRGKKKKNFICLLDTKNTDSNRIGAGL